MSLARTQLQEIDRRIAEAFRRAGFIGDTFDLGQGAGVVPGAAIGYGTPTAAINIGDAADAGTANAALAADAQFAFPAPATGYPQPAGTASADGTATTPARSDHVHAQHLTVYEADGTPSVTNVVAIRVSNSTLTDSGGGTVALSISGFANPMTTQGDLIVGGSAGAATRQAVGSAGQRLASDGTVPVWTDDTLKINAVIDGGGSAIATGIKGDIELPACTLTAVRLYADQSGSVVIDLWKDTYANFPPTVADTITASAKPTLAGADHSQDTTLTGWTTTVAAGDVLRVNVDSASTVERVTLCLTGKRS